MHKRLEQQLRQWFDGRTDALPADFLAALDETYRQADAEQDVLKARLREARELETVGRITGGIAHEFNNLLTVIKGYCDLCLRLAEADGGPVSKGLVQISQATERATEMTTQLLTLSRRRPPDASTQDLNGIMKHFQPMLKRLVSKQTTLQIGGEAPEAKVFADSGRLQQLIMNLVLAAREGLEEGATLRIGTEAWQDPPEPPSVPLPAAPRVVLWADGDGPPEDSLDRSMLAELAEELGGVLLPRGGSRLQVVLPLEGAAPDPTDGGDPTHGAYDASGAARILVVEDEEPVRTMLEALLTDQGHSVTLAPDPADALVCFDQDPGAVDLLLTDIVMPGMYGPEMAEIMKQTRPDLAVLFISGYDPAARERRGAPAPGGAFLQKPFDASTLNSKIQEVLSRP